MPTNSWNESHFPQMSWHGCHVHGMRIRACEYGTGELELDIDFILQRPEQRESSPVYRLAPATLTFLEVHDLRIEVDYETVGAGVVPFSIFRIAREIEPQASVPRWTVELKWPLGQIRVLALGFRQELRSGPITTKCQSLTHEQRTALGA